MGDSTPAERAENRAAAIRAFLKEGNGRLASWQADLARAAEMAEIRRVRPADAMLLDAEAAGIGLAVAVQLHTRKPARPEGCPVVPRAEDLLAVFETAFLSALAAGGV